MVSLSRITKNRRNNHLRKAGRRRKNLLSRRSTPSAEELFADLGEPEKPAPKRKV